MKKKGFTLVELLAVIIILGVIALIAIPTILNSVEDSIKSAYKSSVSLLVNAADKYYVENQLDAEKYAQMNGKTNLIYALEMRGEKPEAGEVYITQDGNIAIVAKYDEYCFVKTFYNNDIVESTTSECVLPYTDLELKGSDPVITDSMIPVIIKEDGTLTKANIASEWYNYADKEWANMVLVSGTSKERYLNAKPGTTINEDDVLAYYVWIPRFSYSIPIGNGTRLINIKFENKESQKSQGTAVGTSYYTHPAFTFGDVELNGFWVGKFETGIVASVDSNCYNNGGTNCNKVITSPRVIPGVKSLRNQNLAYQYMTAKQFNTYGVGNMDAHMMKNTEWAAVAYLATSKYGQGTTEIRVNNNSYNITGCAAASANGAATSTCEIAYGEPGSGLASTTGNITGIYDMSGGSAEYVMGVAGEISEGKVVPLIGKTSGAKASFNGLLVNGETLTGQPFNFPSESKYYDIYVDFYENTTKTGSALSEVSGWNNDKATITADSTWLVRGGIGSGSSTQTKQAGIFFYSTHTGASTKNYTFRSVIS